MRTLDYLKDIYGLRGKGVEWGLVEEIFIKDGKTTTQYHPGLVVRRSRVFVDLYERRFYQPLNFDRLSRKIYPARLERAGDYTVIVARDDESRNMIVPKTFVWDIHSIARYGEWMEDTLML